MFQGKISRRGKILSFAPWLWSGRGLAFFLASLTFLIILSYGGALLSFFSFLNNENEIRMLSRKIHVIDHLVADTRQIRLGRNGYLDSGQKAYLVDYTTGIEKLVSDLKVLQKLISAKGLHSGSQEISEILSGVDPSLLATARSLRQRGLMETRVHFLKADKSVTLHPTTLSLRKLRTTLKGTESIREVAARRRLLLTSGLFGLSFIFFSTFLGVTATRITQDISKVNRLVSHLYHDAHHDFLTGLPNRTFVLESLQDLLAETARTGDLAAILFIDLDGFKAINDRLGHDMGDMALVAVAKRFRGVLPERDILARMGGDEFLLLLHTCDSRETPAQVSSRLIGTLSNPIVLGKRQAILGASIGIALFPDDGEEGEILLKKADEAMYRAKAEGGNQYHFAGISSPSPSPLASSIP